MKHFLYTIKKFFKDIFIYPVMTSQELSYNEYWQVKKKNCLGIPNDFQVERGEWIASRLQEASSVIDVGCGDGSVLFVIKKIKNINASGADVSLFILDFIQSKGISAFFLDLSQPNAIDKIPTHDHMLLLETLEHMAQPEDFLIKSLDKVNKSVFVSIPNTGYVKHRLRMMFGRTPLQWRSHPSEHLRFWTATDFDWWLSSLRLKNTSVVHYYAGIPVLNKIWPALFTEGIIAEIKKPTKA